MSWKGLFNGVDVRRLGIKKRFGTDARDGIAHRRRMDFVLDLPIEGTD
jgi:hypothetical protein